MSLGFALRFGIFLAAVAATWMTRQIIRRFRRMRYERDCYRTTLDVLQANGYFDHKAEELVRQHAPQ